METLTFLNTDIEGSTALLRRVGDEQYALILAAHHHIIRQALSEHHGREDGTAGDSFFAVFTSPRECVAACVQMQRELASAQWPHGEPVKVRMGIHTGEAAENDNGFVGYEVHRAARISAIGHGGQVLLSSATQALVADSLPADTSVKDLGSHRLKDLGRPEDIFQLVIEGLDRAFPPLRSLDNPELPNNLPVSLNQFIGRDVELAEVRELAATSRLVTLTGAGGSGKTRLALQAAAELLDASGDGVWFLELAPINDPDLVPTALITAMSLAIDDDSTPTAFLRRTLKDQRVVIVVDNCEHLVDAVADLLNELLRSCPHVRLLATSREPLGVVGEEVYRVRSLSLPSSDAVTASELAASDSVQLFLLRARSYDKSFVVTDANAHLVASICRRLDGIPLAIELAAARLSSMSLDDLHKRLDQRFRLLTGGSRNALPRQQTLGAMVAWSYDLLNDNERSVLRRLTVFVGGFDLQAAEAVASSDVIDEWDIADILGSLVNKSLVIADRIDNRLRYRLLETIRQYAADQLIQLGESEMLDVRNRHANFYLARCEELEPATRNGGQIEAFEQLDFDRGNIEAAFSHFQGDAAGAHAIMRLACALRVHTMTRWHREPNEYLAWALAQTEGEESIERARAVYTYADFKIMTQAEQNLRLEGWEDHVAYIDRVAKTHNDRRLELDAVALTFFNSYWDPQLRSGLATAAERAQALASELNDPFLLAEAHMMAARAVDDPTEKKDHFEIALVKFREANAYSRISNTLFMIAFEIGDDNEQAWLRRRQLLTEALHNAELVNATSHIDMCVNHLALWNAVLGRYDESETFSRRTLASSLRLGRGAAFVAWLALTMARISLEWGHHERATTLMSWTLKVVPDTPDLVGGVWAVEERRFVEEIETRSRAELGDARYEEMVAAGSSMTMEQIIPLLKQPS